MLIDKDIPKNLLFM